jgi:methionyl-tRNA formyltransferase
MDKRIVFMGSPEFALPSLRGLAAQYPVVGVVTQPDRPAGRGRELTPPPVKVLASELGIPCIQPPRLKDADTLAQLKAWSPDVIVVAAYGQILRPVVLDLPPYGCINVHASLLPRWRGAAPVQAAILHGDRMSGATIMRMDTGVDTGQILSQVSVPIGADETAGTLSVRLAEFGAQLLLDTLPGYLDGSIQPQPQDDDLATYAPLLKKADGELDFSQSAEALERQVRAFNPWPGAYTKWKGQPLKVHHAHAAQYTDLHLGARTVHKGFPAVACASGLLVLDEVQPPGRRAMSGEAFMRGAHDWNAED